MLTIIYSVDNTVVNLDNGTIIKQMIRDIIHHMWDTRLYNWKPKGDHS
jgi:hypothetical protein